MCELFGMTSAKPEPVQTALKAFFSHSVRHPHGYGIFYDGDAILREPVRAIDSTLLASVIEGIQPQTTMLAHIRFATVGRISEENCHPYTGKDLSGRTWTLIHNGTIYSGRFNYQYHHRQRGDTDSERLFLALLDAVNERTRQGDMTDRDRFDTVAHFVAQVAPRNKLNLIIWDGDLLYVHKNLKNTLSFRRTEYGCLFSTHPLDQGEWIPFPIAQVIAYRGGREVFRGERHKGVYVPTLEYITAADAMNI